MLKRHLGVWERLFMALAATGFFQQAWRIPFDWHSDRPLRVLCLLICGALFLYMAATGNPVGPWRHENPKLTRVASFVALALIIALGVLVGRALNGGLLGVTAGLAVVTIGTLAILLGGVLVVRRRTRA